MNHDESLANLIDAFASKCQKIGLYIHDARIMSNADQSDPKIKKMFEDKGATAKEMIDNSDGEIGFAFQAVFTVGDLAFTDRIQNPEAYDTDTQFRMMMPTEAELKAERIRETLAKGGSIMDLFDDDEDDI